MKTKLKTKFPALTLVFYLLLFPFNSSAQNVGVNEIGAAPDESALLDLNATDKGFLITRADTADINSPAFGLMTLSPKDSCLYMHNGKPSGKTWEIIGGAGNNCSCSPSSIPPTPSCGSDNTTQVVDVINPTTNKTWMDRNLGADQVATNKEDSDAYGDWYQWGRCTDGHEQRNSNTTTSLSLANNPEHDKFIGNNDTPYDWLSTQNDNLWQGVNGINNPCPDGYRLPTESELDAERQSWTSNDRDGAFNSPLKFPVAGYRGHETTSPSNVGFAGHYWSSTINGTNIRYLYFFDSNALVATNYRAFGYSVRCIKD